MSKQNTLLIVDDEKMVRDSLSRVLGEIYSVDAAESGAETIRKCERFSYDLIILDYFLNDTDAGDLLPKLMAMTDPPEVIVISGKANINEAVEAVRMGAFDFLVKPFEMDQILTTIQNAIQKKSLLRQRNNLIERNLEKYAIVGNSPAMDEVRLLIRQYAPLDSTVLIQGETGTGKELVAHQIHYLSERAGGPLQTVNCAAIPRELAESELFGFKKGAFTGAQHDKPGKVEDADGGTLFLDEIGEMPYELQSRLLRFLESKEYSRIGENEIRDSDVRVIAATNQNLESAISSGKFRRDLYYRLNACPINIAPLRDRADEIEDLTRHFSLGASQRFNLPMKSFEGAVIALLQTHQWPGNVRELKHIVERCYIRFPAADITPDLLQSLLPGSSEGSGEGHDGSLESLVDDYERGVIIERIRGCGGKLDKAAKSLGIHRSTLHRKLESLDIKIDRIIR